MEENNYLAVVAEERKPDVVGLGDERERERERERKRKRERERD